jgi:hypothetical protein
MALGSSRSPAEPPEPQPTPRTRIRMSALGAGRYHSTVRVLFDGFRSATSLHRTYIEPVAPKEGSSSPDRC